MAGFLSNLGILLWCVSATACFLVAVVVRQLANKRVVKFLLASGALSAWLMFDDLYQLHEDLAHRYLGIGEQLMYLLLGTGVLAYLFAYRQLILRTPYALLAIAVAFLSWSVADDSILEDYLSHPGHSWLSLENSQKWLGICFWCSYYLRMACQFLMPHLQSADTRSTNN